MEYIFHEKQEGSLCAQHCLNALLQGQYFTAVDLASIAQQLDESERQHMAEAGLMSREYQSFLQQPSSNYDDSGFFSIQVIQNALRVWNLDLIPYQSQDAVSASARKDPRLQQAYICNFKEHWFAIRKLGKQWFNLNSLLTGPELISDTYLSIFLAQLKQEGYSIFVVVGPIPDCEASQILNIAPCVQPIKPSLINDTKKENKSDPTSPSYNFAPDELQRAIEESKNLSEQDDKSLQKALRMSMEGLQFPPYYANACNTDQMPSTSTNENHVPSAEEIRSKRLAFLNKMETTSTETSGSNTQGASPPDKSSVENTNLDEMSEEDMLNEAIKMSMGSS